MDERRFVKFESFVEHWDQMKRERRPCSDLRCSVGIVPEPGGVGQKPSEEATYGQVVIATVAAVAVAAAVAAAAVGAVAGAAGRLGVFVSALRVLEKKRQLVPLLTLP